MSNRSWSHRALIGPAAALVLLVACSASTPKRDQLTDALDRSGIPKPVATCVADALVSDLSDGQLDQLVEFGAAGAPKDDPERTDDAADRLREALASCRDQLPTTTTTTTTLDPAGPTIPVIPTTVDGTLGGARLDPGPSTTALGG